jgi:hypothetical protein
MLCCMQVVGWEEVIGSIVMLGGALLLLQIKVTQSTPHHCVWRLVRHAGGWLGGGHWQQRHAGWRAVSAANKRDTI